MANTSISILLLGLAGVLSLGSPLNGNAAGLFNVNAERLAGVQMPIPEAKAAKDYLGLSGAGTFTPSQIKADTVVIEVFNMYCPVCQKEALAVNELHRLIERDKDVQGKVKIIGIGIGNTPFEVDVFRNNFHVPFPLFPDDDSQIKKSSAQPFRTPTFIVARVQSGRTFKIMKVHVGRMEGPEEFLKVIKRLRSER